MNLTDTGRLVLERTDLFAGLGEVDLRSLHDFLEVREAAAGAVLFHEGDQGDSLYIVRRGAVSILKGRDGNLAELARRGPGEMFGEMALIDSAPRFASAVCRMDSELFILSRQRFYEVLQTQPDIAARILRVLASRVRETDSVHLTQLQAKNEDLEAARDRLERLLRQLELSNAHLEAALSYRDRVLSVSPYPVVVTDTQNNVRLINPAAMTLFGQSHSGYLWKWVAPANPTVIATIENALSHGSTWKGEIEVFDSEQKIRICKVVAAPIADTGEGNAARLWILEDLSEMRALEQQALQREELAVKGEMAAEIAHELNNYLAVLSGNAELLAMNMGNDVTPRMRQRLENMLKSIEHIRMFTDNLLNSRHRGGQQIPIDLNAFLQNQIAFLRPQRKIKKIIIQTDWGSGIPEVLCDPSAIQQVFYNLILNAADALAESGTDHCTVGVETRYHPERGVVTLTVRDDGPGISPEVHRMIFKARVSSKPTGHGFGLLTIARIVGENGGSVSASNRPEGGAEFVITLLIGSAIE